MQGWREAEQVTWTRLRIKRRIPCNNNSTAPWSPAMLFSTSFFQSPSLPFPIFLSFILLNSTCIKRPWIHWKRGHGKSWICLSTWEMLAPLVPISSSHLHSPGLSFQRETRCFPTLGFLSSIVQDNWDKDRRDVLSSAQLLPTQPFFTSAS